MISMKTIQDDHASFFEIYENVKSTLSRQTERVFVFSTFSNSICLKLPVICRKGNFTELQRTRKSSGHKEAVLSQKD